MKMFAFAAAAALGLTAPSLAVAPISYDMQNGETGSYTYWDDSYNGIGSTTTSGAFLSGGRGDLTDGVIATQRWDATPALYVGWVTIIPTIDFTFGAGTILSQVSFYFDDAGGYGGVYLPSSIDIDTGGGFQSLAATVTLNGEIARFDYDLGQVSTTSLTARINHPVNSTYIMLTEVAFAGADAAPEPASWAMFIAGFGAIGGAMRRRRIVVRPA